MSKNVDTLNQNSDFEEIKKFFTAYIEKQGHRKTNERFTILKEIYLFEGHFDIETLYMRMKNNKFMVSRATLYNTIELLLECNLVIKHQFGKNAAQYEKALQQEAHDHIIFLDNGDILEFCDNRIQEIKATLEETYNIKISTHSLIFYAKGKNENKNETV